ncbi:MAG: HTH domain-containing protein [Cyanobacteria bacterium J055]|nr:MAG: HTH domain-containing protein [Cyanobacteria bacterium J055]
MRFYKLTEANLPLISQMTVSELKVYCWLNIYLPFDDSKAIEIDTAQLAEELGISRRSAQRALKSLEFRGFFEVEITKAKVKRAATLVSCSDTAVATTTPVSPKRHGCRHDDTDVAETTQVSLAEPATPTPSDSRTPKINKTLKTLSEDGAHSQEKEFENCLNKYPSGEREKFLDFARDKAARLPKPPQLVLKWIAANFNWLSLEFDRTFSRKPSNSRSDRPSALVQNSKYTIEQLQRLYPQTWRDAAAHFGVEIEEPPQFPAHEQMFEQLAAESAKTREVE